MSTRMLLDASTRGTFKTITAEEVRELIENMAQNDYEPRLRKEASQQGSKDTTLEETLLASNKLMQKQIWELSMKLEDSKLGYSKAKSALYKEPPGMNDHSPNNVKFLQKEINYFSEFIKQEQGVKQPQTEQPDGWDKNFYMTYALVKY